MDGSCHLLLKILRETIEAHRVLHLLMHEEHHYMMNLNRELLAEVIGAKQNVLLQIVDLDQKRIGLSFCNASLSEIIEGLEQSGQIPLARELETEKENLKQVLTQIRDQNESNRVLANASLERIEEMKRNIIGARQPSAGYTSTGSRGALRNDGGQLIREKA